jgi:hypothetical protein
VFVNESKHLPEVDPTFARSWRAEILQSRPLILPARQFVYPVQVEEVERGALELLVHPADGTSPFLATCALGFADPIVPTGVWACPDSNWLCAVAGGYAYLLDTLQPNRWTQIEFRPVTGITPVVHQNLLVFAGFHALLAWGRNGLAWKTKRLSWDGVRISSVGEKTLRGFGWDMYSDRELEFEVDLATGEHRGGGYLA